jgi:hypothetical protein
MLSVTSDLATGEAAQDSQRIRIRMRDKAVTVVLSKSEAARDFIAMLPVSIRVRDHLGREKTGRIPTPGNPAHNAGDLGYWRPGGNFVIFYRRHGLPIPPPRIVLLGKVDSPVQIFDTPGPVEVIKVIE